MPHYTQFFKFVTLITITVGVSHKVHGTILYCLQHIDKNIIVRVPEQGSVVEY